MKILLLTDKPNWAYHSIAKSLVKYNISDARLSIEHIKGNSRRVRKIYKKFDRVLVMGWQNYSLVKFLPKDITLVGLHSFHSWDNKKTTLESDVKPPNKLIDFLRSFVSVNAVSQRLTNLFSNNGVDVIYTANGVDTEIFKRNTMPNNKPLIVGYSGSKGHDWRKGVSKFIIPAAKKAGVKVKLAMSNTDKYIALEDMHMFYDKIDCYVCASSSEGMSLSVLEAASCGRPVISTKVSGCTEIIRDGVTGWLVDRKVKEIARKIDTIKRDNNLLIRMSNNIMEDTKKRWSWSTRVVAWTDFLLGEYK